MAGQAGWYRAPGEEGMLRYWNGTKWTDHRQPAPVAAAPEPSRVIAEDPDPMAEYERQFATSPSPFDRPSFDLDQRHFEPLTSASDQGAPSAASTPTPTPQYRPQAALAPAPTPVVAPQFAVTPAVTPRSLAAKPTTSSSPSPIALDPAAIAVSAVAPTALTASKPLSEFEQVLSESAAISATPKVSPHIKTPPVAAPALVVAPNRKAVLGTVIAMGIGILVILLGVGAMTVVNVLNQAGTGEVKTTGIVTSLGSAGGDSCTPIARFAVTGRSFTASSNAAITPCPVGLGQDVDVIYSAANPAAAARIQLGTTLVQYLWLIPLVGIVFFLGSFTAFLVRAGSIVAGVRVLRGDRTRPKKRATASS